MLREIGGIIINAAILLSGGTGSRMKLDIPKQYIIVKDKPIFMYSVKEFDKNPNIDLICIVCDPDRIDFIADHLVKEHIQKKVIYSLPGANRQRSIYSGLQALHKNYSDIDRVVIHDAARPFITQKLIDECLCFDKDYNGVLPVVNVKDTCYICNDKGEITDVPERKRLFAGQAPEGFDFELYYQAHQKAPEHLIDAVYGSTELAMKMGMKIKCVQGDERNIKITVIEDLNLLNSLLK